MVSCKEKVKSKEPEAGNFALAIHGGSGNIEKMNLSDSEKLEYHHILDSALHTGYAILKTGGTSIMAQSIQIKLKQDKGRGGCIAIDAFGNVVFNFTTSGMFRGSVDKNGNYYTGIDR